MKKGLIFITLLFVLNCFGQKHIQIFKHTAKGQVFGVTQDFRFYYIIDSSVAFNLRKFKFYLFTFSTDSNEKTGYISFDQKSGDLLFISDTLQGKDAIRKLFPLKTQSPTNTSSTNYLGNQLVKSTRKDTLIFTVRLTGPITSHDSHSIYLQKLEFKKGDLFPTSLIFFFPFEEGAIRLISDQLSN